MKRKQVTRLLAIATAGIMTVGMTACGGSTGEQSSEAPAPSSSETAVASSEAPVEEETPVEEEAPAGDEYTESGLKIRKDKDGNTVDLGGMEIIIRDWWSGDSWEPGNSNEYDEAWNNYYDEIQELYNFTIKRQGMSGWGDVPADFNNYASAPDDGNNYIFVLYQGADMTAAAKNGLCYDLSTLDCLDFTQDKWRSKVHEFYNIGGKINAMAAGVPEAKDGMYFNKRLLTEAGIDPQSIYDMQEAGTWTWDAFEDLCKKTTRDVDNDGVIDVYGTVMFSSDFYGDCVASNDADFFAKDASGNYVNKSMSAETLAALNWGYNILQNYDYPDPTNGEQWDYFIPGFEQAKGVFHVRGTYFGGQLQTDGMEDEYGFVCFPKGPNAKDYTNTYGENPIVIPACYDADKAWKLAFAYDVFTEPLGNYDGTDWTGYDFDAALAGYQSKFDDTESVDLSVKRMLSNGRLTYQSMIPHVDMGPDFLWNVNKDNTPEQALESIQAKWDACVVEANGGAAYVEPEPEEEATE